MKVEATQLCLAPCDPMNYTVHGILQARILKWVAFPFSRRSFQPRDWTQVSRIAGRFFTSWARVGHDWSSLAAAAVAQGKPKNTGVGNLSLLQGDLPNPGIKLGSPALQADSLPTELWGKPECNSQALSLVFPPCYLGCSSLTHEHSKLQGRNTKDGAWELLTR